MRTLVLPQWRLNEPFRVLLATIALGGLGVLAGWVIAGENWHLVILMSLAMLTPILIRWPVALGFGAYAFLLPFDSVSVISDTGGATLTKLLGVVAVGTLLMTGVTQRRLVPPPFVALFPFLLVLWALMSFAWALNLSASRAVIQTIFSLFIMYIVAASYRVSEKELEIVCVLTVFGGALAAFVGVVLGFGADAGPAVRGTLAIADQNANPNGVAQSLLLPLSAAVGMFLKSRRRWAIVMTLTGIAAIAYGIFLTMSRGSLVALIAMICFLIYRTRARSRMLLVTVVLIALIPLMPDLFFERIVNVWTGDDSTGAGRTDIWAVGVQGLNSFGILGAGIANFPVVYDKYAYTPPLLPARGAHNAYLMTWIELGIVGLAFLLLAIVGHLWTTYRKGSTFEVTVVAASIEAACFGFLVIALFGDPLWSKAFWMPWILIVWAARSRTDPQNQ
jgi:O-antigen ligase